MIDHVIGAINSRFDQDGCKVLCKLENLLCNSHDYLNKYDDVFTLYGDNLDQQVLATQLHVLHCNLPSELQTEKNGKNIKGIVKFLQSLSDTECLLYSMVVQLVKLILVMPATNTIRRGHLVL